MHGERAARESGSMRSVLFRKVRTDSKLFGKKET